MHEPEYRYPFEKPTRALPRAPLQSERARLVVAWGAARSNDDPMNTQTNTVAPRAADQPERVQILDIPIDNLTFRQAVDRIVGFAGHGRASIVVTPNVDHLMKCRRDPELRRVYARADLVLADGMPILWASRFLGRPIVEKVSGSDLLPELCAAAARRGLSVYFLGGRPGAAVRCSQLMRENNPGLQVAGIDCPDFGFEKDPVRNERVVMGVRAAQTDLLFVGLGSPKQEYWILHNLHRLGNPVCLGVGAGIDFAAGLAKRAPAWMQRVGLEWFYRLIHEPRRLWRRYLVEDSPFFFLVLKQKLRRS